MTGSFGVRTALDITSVRKLHKCSKSTDQIELAYLSEPNNLYGNKKRYGDEVGGKNPKRDEKQYAVQHRALLVAFYIFIQPQVRPVFP